MKSFLPREDNGRFAVPSRRARGMCACKCKVDVVLSTRQAVSGGNVICVLARVFGHHVKCIMPVALVAGLTHSQLVLRHHHPPPFAVSPRALASCYASELITHSAACHHCLPKRRRLITSIFRLLLLIFSQLHRHYGLLHLSKQLRRREFLS